MFFFCFCIVAIATKTAVFNLEILLILIIIKIENTTEIGNKEATVTTEKLQTKNKSCVPIGAFISLPCRFL